MVVERGRHFGDDVGKVPRFTKDAASKTGRGERSIQRDIEVADPKLLHERTTAFW